MSYGFVFLQPAFLPGSEGCVRSRLGHGDRFLDRCHQGAALLGRVVGQAFDRAGHTGVQFDELTPHFGKEAGCCKFKALTVHRAVLMSITAPMRGYLHYSGLSGIRPLMALGSVGQTRCDSGIIDHGEKDLHDLRIAERYRDGEKLARL